MKCVLCLVLCFVASIYGYPQRVTIVGVPRSVFDLGPYDSKTSVFGDESEEGSVIGGKAGVPYDPSGYNPYAQESFPSGPAGFSELMAAMQEMMFSLRQEMGEILRRIPASKDEGNSVVPFGHPSEIDLSNAKNESTSKTEVIDGQLYTINETVVRSGDDGFGSVFRVKTIQVRPTETSETVVPEELPKENTPDLETTPHPTSSEAPGMRPSNNDDKNEITPDVKIESANEWDVPENEETSVHENEIDTSNQVEIFDSVEGQKPLRYHDLSGDTLVNQYLSDQQLSQGLVLMNPDAEFIDGDKSNQKRDDDYYRYESHTAVKTPPKSEKLIL